MKKHDTVINLGETCFNRMMESDPEARMKSDEKEMDGNGCV